MARDIEEFLRKAAERRKQQAGGGGNKPAQPQPPRQQPAPQQRAPQQPPRQKPRVVEAEVVQASRRPAPAQPPRKISNLRNESVADHVKSHINTSSIASHAEQLGDRISSVHDEVDARIHRSLDRDLTEIDDTPSVTDAPRPAIFGKRSTLAADEIRKMLSDPRSVGQAILVSEILKRPNF